MDLYICYDVYALLESDIPFHSYHVQGRPNTHAIVANNAKCGTRTRSGMSLGSSYLV